MCECVCACCPLPVAASALTRLDSLFPATDGQPLPLACPGKSSVNPLCSQDDCLQQLVLPITGHRGGEWGGEGFRLSSTFPILILFLHLLLSFWSTFINFSPFLVLFLFFYSFSLLFLENLSLLSLPVFNFLISHPMFLSMSSDNFILHSAPPPIFCVGSGLSYSSIPIQSLGFVHSLVFSHWSFIKNCLFFFHSYFMQFAYSGKNQPPNNKISELILG